jgi:type IX secretion system PorP/SprF family membrane protein
MKTRYRIVLAGMLMMLAYKSQAQDIHFSQYLETPTTLNPALFGLNYDTRVIANYRSQWSYVTGASKAYQTYGVSYDGGYSKKLRGRRIGWGMNLINDAAGDAKMKSLLPSVGMSYIGRINRQMKASAGFQFGLNYRQVSTSNLRWGAQYRNYEYDASVPSGEQPAHGGVLSTDAGGGVHFSYAQSEKYISSKDGSKFDCGFAAYHLKAAKSSFFTTSERLDPRFIGYMSGEFFIPKMRIALDPSLIVQFQGKSHEFITGLMFKYVITDESKFTSIKKPSAISFGATYRYKDAIIPAFLWQYDKYALGFAYDINVSQLTPASRLKGGLEVMLRYNTALGYGKNLGRTDTKASY